MGTRNGIYIFTFIKVNKSNNVDFDKWIETFVFLVGSDIAKKKSIFSVIIEF